MGKVQKTSIALFLIMALLIFLAGCGASVKAESFTGTATGYHGHLEVTTEIGEDGKIAGITVDKNNETEGIGTVAMEKIPQRIIEAGPCKIRICSPSRRRESSSYRNI